MSTPEPLLVVRDLHRSFPVAGRSGGVLRAVDGVSFDVRPGRALGLVGESGSGKTTTGRLVTRLLVPDRGCVRFAGRELTSLSEKEIRPLRPDFQMVFQQPGSTLNPAHTLARSVGAPLRRLGLVPRRELDAAVADLLVRVGLDPAIGVRRPHECSGGQVQRAALARALGLRPRLLVADEPVTALDVSAQAQIVNLLRDLQEELGLTLLVIAHDLAVVRHLCDRVAVMYLGRLVELGDRDAVYAAPAHPYTQALLSAVPVADPDQRARRDRIRLIGDPPPPLARPVGCRFAPRCAKARERCRVEDPPLLAVGTDHQAACHFPGP